RAARPPHGVLDLLARAAAALDLRRQLLVGHAGDIAVATRSALRAITVVVVLAGGAIEQRVQLGARQIDQPFADAHANRLRPSMSGGWGIPIRSSTVGATSASRPPARSFRP